MKVLALLLVICSSVSFIETQFDVGSLASAIIGLAGQLFDSGTLSIMDHNCQYEVKPRISKFKLKYDGSVWCPGWTDIKGTATTESKSGAIEKSLEDFINKAVQGGVITQQQAEDWQKKYQG